MGLPPAPITPPGREDRCGGVTGVGREGYPGQPVFYGPTGHIGLDKGGFEGWGYPGQSLFYGRVGHIGLDMGGFDG